MSLTGCGPSGLGRRARIPFALTIARPPGSASTFVGYHPVGTSPAGSTGGAPSAARSNTATAFMPAAVTYNRPPSTAHEVGAAPYFALAPRLPGKCTT